MMSDFAPFARNSYVNNVTISQIRKLRWSVDDTKLYSVGSDGAIYEWDVATQRRTAEFIERGSSWIDAVPTADTKQAYAINSLKFIKEIQLAEGVVGN